MLAIPLRSDLPDFSFSTDLDGATFNIRLRFNLRDGGWYFDFADAVGAPLLAGKRFALNTSLLAGYPDARFPPGRLVAVSTTGDDAEVGAADLGKRVQLLYVTEAALG